jgi:hypothetical protein
VGPGVKPYDFPHICLGHDGVSEPILVHPAPIAGSGMGRPPTVRRSVARPVSVPACNGRAPGLTRDDIPPQPGAIVSGTDWASGVQPQWTLVMYMN